MAFSRGKWTKHNIMRMSPALRLALPDTRLLNQRNFIVFMRTYKHVIVKPSNGSGGAGVMQVTAAGNGYCTVRYGKIKKTINGLHPTYAFLRSKIKRTYIIQQRIPLAQWKRKPFDVRVMVQRRRGSNWVVTGTLAKIAGSGYFITNLVRSKGKAVPLHAAIRHSNIQGSSSKHIQQQIHRLALTSARHLQTYYRIHTIGLDVGIDPNGKVWLIEANFMPDKTYFLRLKDKTMYRRIMAFYRNR